MLAATLLEVLLAIDEEDVAAIELDDGGLAGPATLRPATNWELGVLGVVNCTPGPLVMAFLR